MPKTNNTSVTNTSRAARIVRTSIIGIVANVALAAFKAVVGLLANSIAIVLDAVNNATDALSSIVTIIGTRLAGRAADYNHPFGHGRAEYLTAIVIGIIVLYAGVTSLIESVRRIIQPEVADYRTLGLGIVAVAVVVKIVLGLYVKRVGTDVNSDSLIGSGTDALLDAVISATTVVAALIFIATGISLEAPLGAIISLVIIKAAYDILQETISKLLGRRVDTELSRGIKQAVAQVEGVHGVYDLVITDYGPEQLLGSMHVEVPETYTANDIDRLTREIQTLVAKEFDVIVAAVGIYTRNTESAQAAAMRRRVEEIAYAHKYVKEVHGFYLNEAAHAVNFDLVLDFAAPDRNALYADIFAEVKAAFPDYAFAIVLDNDVSD